jgi:LmbE family N-acetylglucosaminyl deacetylase
VSIDQSKLKKQRALKRRLAVYGGILAAIYGFYLWVPWEIDFIPRGAPHPNPPVDPDTKFLFSGKAKVLLVTAHPDDSAFYVGGLLTKLAQAGAEIHQVICTDGDKGYYPFEDWQWNRRTRRQEALAEAKTWHGKDILFLGRPDGRLRNDGDLVESIKTAIRRVKPDYVLCFDGAYPPRMSHQDHRRAGEAAFQAAQEMKVPWVLQFSTSAPNHIVDISKEWDAQQELLAIHKSQFYGDHLTGIIGMVGGNAEKEGALAGFDYGEGLKCVRVGASR